MKGSCTYGLILTKVFNRHHYYLHSNFLVCAVYIFVFKMYVQFSKYSSFWAEELSFSELKLGLRHHPILVLILLCRLCSFEPFLPLEEERPSHH
mmetsp:Transcript_21040/g.31923  ORF Transcript_21040/g.31923 Transcript_21040/m.31923 type:complete len:94 (-) Transcript_21040:256-537(-)